MQVPKYNLDGELNENHYNRCIGGYGKCLY